MKEKLGTYVKSSEKEKICIKSNISIDFIEVKDIIYLKTDNNYTIIHKKTAKKF